MHPLEKLSRSNNVLMVFLFGILLGFILVIFGWILIPTTSLLSIAGICLILVVYALVGYFAFPRIQPEILRLVVVFGFLAGIVFAGEILLEYALLPKDNTSWGLIEFGSVFALYFLGGLWATYKSKSIKEGTLAAILSAMFGSVIWLIFVLLTFYLFRGTMRQVFVFRAEGNFEDFARSGMKDFNTFVMEDFLGAGFFHLLLSPLFAALLGAIGSLLGKGIVQLRKH
jgi:hypothetical protein